MVLSAQATRAWKLASYVFTGGVTFHMIFHQEYVRPDGKEDHVFSDIQKWYRQNVDSMLGLDIPSSPQSKPKITKEADAQSNNSTPSSSI